MGSEMDSEAWLWDPTGVISAAEAAAEDASDAASEAASSASLHTRRGMPLEVAMAILRKPSGETHFEASEPSTASPGSPPPARSIPDLADLLSATATATAAVSASSSSAAATAPATAIGEGVAWATAGPQQRQADIALPPGMPLSVGLVLLNLAAIGAPHGGPTPPYAWRRRWFLWEATTVGGPPASQAPLRLLVAVRPIGVVHGVPDFADGRPGGGELHGCCCFR
eukprot:CAMPEP_0115640158 /NCGR_PEP_ID=MMETSP0272-20121206/35640_1 /TAXON_ID=71861 /ORGANISM="Scrippsiella trochoidea, Strain CCMP3099" /LENGTH=225 /DNA_ID=CAMNT_0003077385 /DNA_START=57 /DNA_END=730 /DNA_ORIENTATION=-